MLLLEKFSIGVGDRFGHEAEAQLRACQRIAGDGVDVTPVWNKSNREHLFIGSEPSSVAAAAREAVNALGWQRPWHVDADHIRLETVERYLPHCDFFTIDVADAIGRAASSESIKKFLSRHSELIGHIPIRNVAQPLHTEKEEIRRIAGKFLLAIEEAGRIYRRIVAEQGENQFIAEVSMDETDQPQTPIELLVILAALADENVRAQTIAPKFTGRFNKGVDYVGDLEKFATEFRDDLAVISHATARYALPSNLKLSVHSGSDKFSLYPVIRGALRDFNAGVHLKTAGTTWLEELIGLAEAGDGGLRFAQELYARALREVDALCEPYATVIDIDRARLPSSKEVAAWSGQQFTGALRHEPQHPLFNPHFRQLLHVAFKLAAKEGAVFSALLQEHREIVSKNVTENLYVRHLKPLFGP